MTTNQYANTPLASCCTTQPTEQLRKLCQIAQLSVALLTQLLGAEVGTAQTAMEKGSAF